MSTKLGRSLSFLAFAALVLALVMPAAARPVEVRPLDAGADSFSLEGLWATLVALWTPSAGAVEDAAPTRPDLAKDGEGGEDPGDGDEGGNGERHYLQIEPGG